MQPFIKKIKLCLALFCIGSMATLLGIPVIPKDKIEQIIQANNPNVAVEVVQANHEHFSG